MLNPVFRKKHAVQLMCAVAGTAMLTACVDHDYDLSKDIDLTVTLGGNELTLPTSSTDVYTMAQILDLDPENSSIKPVETQGQYGLNKGDYVLTQTGDPSESTVSIDAVNLSDITGSTVKTMLDPFVVVAGMPEIAVNTGNIVTTTSISDKNVTPDIRTLTWIGTDCEMILSVHYNSDDFNGNAIIKKGTVIKFDESWKVEIADDATRSFAHMANDHTLEFTNDKTVSNSGKNLQIRLNVPAFDLANLPAGQGLTSYPDAPGHFLLDSDIVFNGQIAIATKHITSGVANLELVTETAIPMAKILEVRGTVDPDITINPTSFNITDVPDFLSEPGNNLDVENPQLYFTVENTSPVPVTINAKITAHDNGGNLHTVGIGANYGTTPIYVDANATTNICVCRTGNAVGDNLKIITVPTLSDLLVTVPDKIEITDIDAKADQSKEVTIALNEENHPHVYAFNASYDAVIPLAFGENLKFTYETTDEDWGEDLEKYNFDRVNISLNVSNTAPLNMKPIIDALDSDGQVINDVTATIDGIAKAGSLTQPTNSTLKAVLKSTGPNLKNLDGIRIRFETSSDAACAGQALNEAQALRFTEIRISISGGVTIDLND